MTSKKKVAISWKSSATSVISISNATGVVYRKKANANVTLTASLNKGDYTNTKIFLLTVVGDNTRPRFTTLLTFSVNENISNDAVVGTVVATDDVGGTGVIAYAITDGNDGDVFAIDINGVLTIVGDIDYENINRYTLSIQVIDAADNRATGTFTVNVINIDDTAPVIAANQLFFVEENVSNGTVVGTVVATDDEAGGTGVIAYEIIDGNFGDLFAIDNNGQLTAAGAIDRENTASHTLVVRVSDANSNMDTATITVNVINVDDSPPIIVAQSFPVDENVPVGTVVGRVDANDNPGGSGIVSFQITAGILEMPLPLITMGS